MAHKMQFRAIVRGRVQGVYYRASTVEEARALDLAGYARNLPDGSVEVVARGAEESLRALIDYLKVGPAAAAVSGVDIDWNDATPVSAPFSIRR